MDRNFSMIKARIAEAIIKQMFIENGFLVFENGVERNKPEIMDKIIFKNHKVAREIRFSPDFVVINPSNGDMFYLEVKYRKDGYFKLENMEHFPYTNAHFVIVSKNDIQWITFNKLKENGFLSGTENFQIENCDLFHLDKNSVAQYRKYVQTIFGNMD